MAFSVSGSARCLVLACGNTLREDDGIGLFVARWAARRFADEPRVRVIARQQWTPELAQDLAEAEAAVFVDCAVDAAAGEVRLERVSASTANAGPGMHHLSAAELLALSQELYGRRPRTSLLLTVGAGSLELREGFSERVRAAAPLACAQLEGTLRRLLAGGSE